MKDEDQENYDDFRQELRLRSIADIKHFERMANVGIFHAWAVRAIKDELKERLSVASMLRLGEK